MAAIHGYIQSHDYSFMYNTKDLRKNVKPTYSTKNSLLAFLFNNNGFEIFKYIVITSGFGPSLDDPQSNYTVFIPTDKSLYSKGLTDATVLNLDRMTCLKIVKYSMIDRTKRIELFMDSPMFEQATLLRSFKLVFENLNWNCDEQNTTLPSIRGKGKNMDTNIIYPNVVMVNGIIHVTDNLLISDHEPLR
ncbi:MAG: fasciclin domain-containing protein [Colwellia sp.]|nr:fasciclin domain-containing protein [Colwellia sp.]